MNPLTANTTSGRGAATPVFPKTSMATTTSTAAATNGELGLLNGTSNATSSPAVFSVASLQLTPPTVADAANIGSSAAPAGANEGKSHVRPPIPPLDRSGHAPASAAASVPSSSSNSGLANGASISTTTAKLTATATTTTATTTATTSGNSHTPSSSANGQPPPPKPKGPMMRRTGGGPAGMSSRLSIGSTPASVSSIPASPRVVNDISVPIIPSVTTQGGGLGLTSRSSRPPNSSSIAAHPMLQTVQREWENPAPKSIPGINATTDDQPSLKRQAESPQQSSFPPAKRQHFLPHNPQPKAWGGISSSNKVLQNGHDDGHGHVREEEDGGDGNSGSESGPNDVPLRNDRSRVVGDDTTDTDYASGYSDTDETDGDEDDDEDIPTPIPAPSSTTSSAVAPGVPTVVSDVLRDMSNAVEILNTQDGRQYRQFYDSRGLISKLNGAIFPTGYQEDKESRLPWVCPVRSCRKPMQALWGLGGHFSAVHYAQCLNDNLDGTFTIVGRRQPRPGEKTPVIVVSQNPGDPDEPMAVPEIPPAKVKARLLSAASSRKHRLKAPDRSKLHQIPSLHPGRTSRAEMEQNFRSAKTMMEDLVRSHGWTIPSKFYQDETLKYLLRRSRVRNLKPSLEIYSGTQQISESLFMGMLLYMLGQVKLRSCTNCPKGNCIGLPAKLPQNVLLRLGRECANCMLTTPRQPCSFALAGGVNDISIGPDEQEDEDEDNAMETDTLANTPDLHGIPEGDNKPQERPSPEKRDSEATEEDGKTIRNLRRRQREVDYRLGLRPSRSGTASAAAAAATTTTTTTTTTTAAAAVAAAAAASQRVAVDVDMSKMIEMEEWEVAPGIIKTTDGEGIFYSNTFLSNNKTIKVSRGVGFTVHILRPGELLKLESKPDIVRVCHVSSGKVKAKVDGVVEEVSLGPSGMLRVPPGKAAIVTNRMYMDAVLNVTSVDQS